MVNERTDDYKLVDLYDDEIYDFHLQDEGGLELSHDRRGIVSIMDTHFWLSSADSDPILVSHAW